MHVSDGSGSGVGAGAVGRGADAEGRTTVESADEGVREAPDETGPELDSPPSDVPSSPFFCFSLFFDSDADGEALADARSAADEPVSPLIGRALLAPVGAPSTESSATASGTVAA
ncbi:hypothetical protein [Streptomyces jeddahensis]|uniref:Uncharacterized protein n=1 Tax=Streptomyces jeddahensis TaxID=1716141 RepID=A0A177HHQ6_9ACTN|nr:hypothetical protein [Streptomyces jeddahensis]OAH09814.1 hypothetical protein STSP_68130 [Streptomyces jeddahensis]